MLLHLRELPQATARDQLHEHGVYIAEADEEEEKDGMRRKVDLRCEIDVIIERENDV